MINGRTNTVVATVHVGGAPAGVAVNPRTSTIYVANESRNTVPVINGRTNTIVATVRHVATPVWVAVNPRTSTIYVTNAFENEVSVLTACQGRTGTPSHPAHCHRG